jgi:hypothetical protein
MLTAQKVYLKSTPYLQKPYPLLPAGWVESNCPILKETGKTHAVKEVELHRIQYRTGRFQHELAFT